MTDTPETLRNVAEVQFGGRTVQVKELSLRKFQALGSVVGQIEALGKALGDIENLEPGEVIKTVGNLFTTAPEVVAQVISTATDLTQDEVLDGTISEVLEVVAAVIRVNNFMSTFKKKVTGAIQSG